MALVEAPVSGGFGLNNLPWGVFRRCGSTSDAAGRPAIGVALGQHVVDVSALQQAGLLSGPILSKAGACLQKSTLNDFMSLGKSAWSEARTTLQRLLSAQEGVLRDNVALREQVLIKQDDVVMQLPADIGDYTDFYVSRNHAFNCGALFRGPGQELQPNWVHLPVAYHGRSSTIVPSGVPVRRPWGQVLPAGSETPSMSPCAALDFELEMGCFIGNGNKMGEPIKVDSAADHIFGMVLLNDWSARDIQKWETVPLGPFNGKNFATQISPWVVTWEALQPFACDATSDAPSKDPDTLPYTATQISPWVVTWEALQPFACDAPSQDPPVLPYLREERRKTVDIKLAAEIVPPEAPGHSCPVSQTNFNTMYYTWPQMVAHHTLGGCMLRPGDLLGSGTVSSGPDGQRGCLLEATYGGKRPLDLRPKGQGEGLPAVAQRAYLKDGDEVVLSGWCEDESGALALSFGQCRGVVLPAHEGVL